MQHDIYSLGVILLEIGLWTSFVVYDSGDDKSVLPKPHPMLGAADLNAQTRRGGAFDNKKTLEALAERGLPARLGTRYTNIVLLCLRCLDSGTG